MSPTTTPPPGPAPAGGASKTSADSPPLEVFFRGNRLLAGGALLVLLELVPIAGLVMARREANEVWTVLAGVLFVGALLPPVGILLGHRWGYLLGQYVVWGSLVGLILRVLQSGFTLVFLLPASLLGVLLVALSPPRGPTEPRKTSERKPESFGTWIKENVEAIVVAFIMALVIRCFCIEVFKIPSSSMEPILLGDVSDKHSRESCPFGAYHVPLDSPTASGDRIMVTKYFYAFSPIERYDVVVFKFPLNQAKNFIKRVVGLPNESIKVYHGNLYVKKPGQDKFHIAGRTWRTQNSLWIDVSRATNGYLGSEKTFGQFWETAASSAGGAPEPPVAHQVSEGELATQESSGQRSSRFNLKHIPDDGQSPVDDVRILFDFELTSPKGQVFAEVSNAYGRFEAILDTDGGSQLVCHLPTRENHNRFEKQIVPLRDVQLAIDHHYRLELLVYDGIAHVRVNDGERAKFQFIDTREDLVELENPERRISFGSRGATFKVRNLAVGRDIYYRGRDRTSNDLREDEELAIPDGKYVMMGDNVANSHDSRAWQKHTYQLKNGKTIVCEEQQIIRWGDFLRTLQERFELPRAPDIGIDGDEHGNDIAIFQEDLVPDGERTEKFRFVDEKFIVGKALWIWWPQGRWFHLIR